ncbi:MAG: hypothetical protein ACO3NT_04390, partial [Candidatus Nanopelagicaceae bacterium]
MSLLSFLITASLLFAATPSNGAVKAGAACKQVGKIATKSGTEYRCVKKGKKLVWKKITKAMELIASSRIVKAQQRLEASTPYLLQLTQAVSAAASHA